MRHSIRSGWYEWWVDRNPPREGPLGASAPSDKVRCHGLHDAVQLIWRIFDGDTGLQAGRLLKEESQSYALHRVSLVERHQQVAWLIVTRRLRVWRRLVRLKTAVGGGGASSAQAARSLSPPMPPSRPATAAAAVAPTPLFWYEFILHDELGEGLPGVEVELTTPAGRRRLKTNGAGSVRVDNVPAGQGSALIDGQSLALALEDRAERPRRKSRPPAETADFKVVTPLRAGRVFSFAGETAPRDGGQPHGPGGGGIGCTLARSRPGGRVQEVVPFYARRVGPVAPVFTRA